MCIVARIDAVDSRLKGVLHVRAGTKTATFARHYDGSLTYLHKVKQQRHIYFFANSSERIVDTTVTLRGHLNLNLWDPMTGEICTLEETYSQSKDKQALTHVPLKLTSTTAVFYIGTATKPE